MVDPVVGAGAVVGGSIFGLIAISKNSSGEGTCTSNVCPKNGLDEIRQADDYATVSTILFIAGGALLAGGAALYFTAPRPSKTAFLNPWTGTLHW